MRETIYKEYKNLITGEDKLSILANTSAFINEELGRCNWVGFYLMKDGILKLGPFQGKVACYSIPVGKGVCGTCAKLKETVVVENVHEFPGHIACDSASNSEIVVPILVDGNLYGVLDLDSTEFSRFQKEEQEFLEKIVDLLVEELKK